MLLTIVFACVTYKARGVSKSSSPFAKHGELSAAFKQNKDNKIWSTKPSELLIQCGIFIGGIVASTFTMLLVVYLNLQRVLIFMLSFTIFALFIFVSSLFWFTMATAFNLTVDSITAFFLILNNAFLSYVSLMWKSPTTLRKFYHIYLSLLLAWFLNTFTQPLTGWAMLALLSVWDLIAVVPKHGPLNMIIRIMDKRGQSLPTALIYSTFFHWRYFTRDRTWVNTNLNNNNEETRAMQTDSQVNQIIKTYLAVSEHRDVAEEKPHDDDDGPKLGIGDFVFYSLLVAKTTVQMSFFTTLCCFLTILVGLLITMILVAYFNRPLPALPISIFLSGLIYFSFHVTDVQRYQTILNVNQVYI
jgi:hypothetical protein